MYVYCILKLRKRQSGVGYSVDNRGGEDKEKIRKQDQTGNIGE